MQVGDEEKAMNHRRLTGELILEIQHDIGGAEQMIQGSQDLLARISLEESKVLAEKDPLRVQYANMREKYKESIKLARNHKKKLADIIDKIKAQPGMEYRPEPIPLIDTVHDAVTMCSGMLEHEGISLFTDYILREPEQDPKMMGDRVRLMTVVMNLFSNMKSALQMTRDKQVRVGIFELDYDIPVGRIVMSNNGPRLPFEDLEEAFKPYRSGSGSTGLGLPICKDIIEERFGGKMYAAHPAKGGVAFYMEIPLLSKPE